MPKDLIHMSEGIDDPWVDDWTSEESPEPDDHVHVTSIEPGDISAMAMSSYDNIGESATADTIAAYLATKSVSRSLWMTVLHNSATPASSDRGLTTVKGFASYHMNTRGWKAIGYHFVIDTKGVIWAGRKMSVLGAHAGSAGNPGSIGVCLVGNFETADRPTEAQKKAFAALHVALHDRYYGSAPLRVRFHREFMNTACPGKITQDEVMGWISDNGGTPEPTPCTKIYLDDEFIANGVLIDGRTYGPLRATFEKAGFKVGWVESQITANLTSPGQSVVPPPSDVMGTWKNPKVILDGKLLGTGVLVQSSTYVPVRVTFEDAGFHVDWKAGAVYITSP